MIEYRVYAGDHASGPIDYTTPIATVTVLTWTGSALPLDSTTRYGVRVHDTASGLTELNTDATVEITVSAAGADLGGVPAAPQGILATAIAGGAVRIEWTWPFLLAPFPDGFHVYRGVGTVDYTTVVADVPFGGPARATLAGLTDGVTYLIAVRAYNATGEEANEATTSVTADATPPANVENLTATPTSRVIG